MKNNTIILPINENPPIKGYLHHAHIISVITAKQKNSEQWVKSHFLQLYFLNTEIDNIKVPSLDFYVFPYDHDCLSCGYVHNYLLFNSVNLSIEKALQNGYYVTTIVDEYYIPNLRPYRKKHISHWFLIYGYDMENYYSITYTKSMNYETIKVDKNVFNQAFIIEFGLGLNKIKENYVFTYEETLANDLVKDYVNGTNTSEKYGLFRKPLKGLFGIHIYEGLLQDLKNGFDFRYAQILLEHKQCIYAYLQKMYPEKELLAQYQEVIKDVKILKNLYIKQNILYNLDLHKRIEMLLLKIKEKEMKVLLQVV